MGVNGVNNSAKNIVQQVSDPNYALNLANPQNRPASETGKKTNSPQDNPPAPEPPKPNRAPIYYPPTPKDPYKGGPRKH